MNQEHLLIILGVALFFAGLISGLVIPKLTLPRMGLTSHLEGTQNGMFLILVGLIWGRLDLSELWLQIAFWTLLYGTWANWGAALLAGIWGTGERSPIASGGTHRYASPRKDGFDHARECRDLRFDRRRDHLHRAAALAWKFHCELV